MVLKLWTSIVSGLASFCFLAFGQLLSVIKMVCVFSFSLLVLLYVTKTFGGRITVGSSQQSLQSVQKLILTQV